MKIFTLLVFLSWPWSGHVERGTIYISGSHKGVGMFKKPFQKSPDQIQCTLTSLHGNHALVRALTVTGVEVISQPDDTVSYVCK